MTNPWVKYQTNTLWLLTALRMTSLPLTLVRLTLAYLSSLISSFSSFMCSSHSSLLSVPRHGKLIPVSGPLHLLLILSWSLFYRTASFIVRHVSPQVLSSPKGLPTLSWQKPTSDSMLPYFIYSMELSTWNHLLCLLTYVSACTRI